MLRSFDAVERRVGLERDAADFWIQLLQSPRGPHACPRGPKHGDEMRDTSLRLLPDFVRGGVIMRPPVSIVRILIRIKIKIGMLRRILPRNLDGPIGTF